MKFNEINKNYCKNIIDKNEHFYEKKVNEDISIFSYRLASYKDFSVSPYLEEFRGLTFVGDERYLSLHKFFNINETEELFYKNLKHLKIKEVTEKIDGSLMRFVKVNNKVVPKTKMDFNHSILNDISREYYVKNKKMIDWSLDNRIALLFECITPLNQIVIFYNNSDLVLLKARNEDTGEYLDVDRIGKDFNVKVIDKVKVDSLDTLLELAETVVDKEGWVVEFENGLHIKIKTKWYLERHRLCSSGLQYNNIIESLLDETIDDILSIIPEGEKKLKIIEVIDKFEEYFNQSVINILEKLKEIKDMDKKATALFLLKEKYNFFGIIMDNFNDLSEDKIIISLKNYFRKKFAKESDCIHFIKGE